MTQAPNRPLKRVGSSLRDISLLEDSILIANTGFPEIDHLSAATAQAGMLSRYVRPYANLERPWERWFARVPGVETFYARSFGRRRMPPPLTSAHIQEAGVLWDFVLAMHARLLGGAPGHKSVHQSLLHARTNAVARAAAKALTSERAAVSGMGCAEHLFRRITVRGAGLCVLNYSIAHHRFTQRYLLEEAELRPAFADTLSFHDLPAWLEHRLDAEIDLADRILVGSSFARDTFIAEGVPANKLVVIPYGADTRLFEPPEPSTRQSDKLRLLFVGQIGQRKGISYLLEAVRRMTGKGILLTLVGQIQGDGRALEPYRHLFRHIPHVPRVALREIYRQADVFVFPTLVEGMGLVVLEAMASGLPVITTANGPGDIVRDGVDGFLVPPRDVEAVLARLERLRADPSLRVEMSQNARQRAEVFTWQAYRDAAVSQLREWLEHSPSPKLLA